MRGSTTDSSSDARARAGFRPRLALPRAARGFAAAAALALAAQVSAAASPDSPFLQAELMSASGHAWRGKVLRDAFVLQPSGVCVWNEWSAGVWVTADPSAGPGRSGLVMAETEFGYTREADNLLLAAAVRSLHFGDPREFVLEDDTFELVLDATADAFLMPSLTVYWDVAEKGGVYARCGVAHSHEFTHRVNLDVNLMLGLAERNYLEAAFWPQVAGGAVLPAKPKDNAKLVDATALAALSIALTDSLTLTPRVEYMRVADGDIADALRARCLERSLLAASVSLAWTF